MALLFIEGFEQYDTAGAQIGTLQRGGWRSNVTFTTANFDIQTGRQGAGTQCVRLGFTGRHLHQNIPETDDVTCGFAFKLSGGPGNLQHFGLRYGLVDHLTLFFMTTGEIELRRGTSTLLESTSGLGLVAGDWHYLEINAKIHDSTGDYDVHFDGAQILQGTSQDTQNGSSALVDSCEWVGQSAQGMSFDDIYILDDAGSDNVGLLGDCRVETVFPDADGNETDFTPLSSTNVSNVDDGLVPDDDTTYNSSATVTDRDLYGFAALAGDVGTVFGVKASMLVRKEEAGFREVRVIARNGTTEVESADFTLGTSYAYRTAIYENNVDGGADWTEATVNTAQFGIDLST